DVVHASGCLAHHVQAIATVAILVAQATAALRTLATLPAAAILASFPHVLDAVEAVCRDAFAVLAPRSRGARRHGFGAFDACVQQALRVLPAVAHRGRWALHIEQWVDNGLAVHTFLHGARIPVVIHVRIIDVSYDMACLAAQVLLAVPITLGGRGAHRVRHAA